MRAHVPKIAIGLTLLAATALAGCFKLKQTEAGGMTHFDAPRTVDATDVRVPDGYTVTVVATGLSMPSEVAFDEAGRVYVTEAGYSYGDVRTVPRLLRIEPDGSTTEIARGDNPPWTGLTFYEGAFYVAGGHFTLGQILRITPDGAVDVVVDGLPSLGDHFAGGPAFSDDGWMYFSQGTATNSGIVDSSSFDFGWPRRYPDFHDIPCEDVVLTGKNYRMPDLFTDDPDDEVLTGAYVPFGTATEPGQVVEGAIPCTGAVFRARPDGTELELVAWGFRNLYGMDFGPDGALYVSENQYDVRGARPVFGTGELVWRVEPGRWYGWPDYWGSELLDDRSWFEAPGKEPPGRVLLELPGVPPKPVAALGVHAALGALVFSHSEDFGYVGEAFVAEFGSMVPATGKLLAPVGYKVSRVNVETGEIDTFLVNAGEEDGPASWMGTNGLERPLGLAFDPAGGALYVVDFGVMTTLDGTIAPRPGTGVLWRVTRDDYVAEAP